MQEEPERGPESTSYSLRVSGAKRPSRLHVRRTFSAWTCMAVPKHILNTFPKMVRRGYRA